MALADAVASTGLEWCEGSINLNVVYHCLFHSFTLGPGPLPSDGCIVFFDVGRDG